MEKAADAVDAVRANFFTGVLIIVFFTRLSKLFAFFVQFLAFLLTFERF